MKDSSEKLMPDFCNRRYPFHYATAMHLLRKMNISIDSIEIMAVGEYENYKGEVREQTPAAGTPLKRGAKISLKVGYLSAVDLMPYQFFYGLAGITDRASDWENNARLLMSPFDAAFVRYDSKAAYETLKYNFNFLDNNHLLKYLELYDFAGVDIADPKDALRWLALMPNFHIWAGNADMTARVLEFLFGYSFRIIESVPSEHEIPDNIQSRLGAKCGRLGTEFVIGRSFVEYDTGYEVIVSNIDANDVPDILPGKPLRRKIEAVLDYCMPGNLDYQIRVMADREKTVLGRKEKKGFLGYNSYL